MEWISDEADLDSTSAHTYVMMEGFIGTFGEKTKRLTRMLCFLWYCVCLTIRIMKVIFTDMTIPN